MDCSGTIVYVLQKMGYDVPDNLDVRTMVSGNCDWLSFFNDVKEERSGSEGILNFYQFEGDKRITHVNAGVGKKGNEIAPQIVDATEGEVIKNRNGNPKQPLTAGVKRVNQTFAPFSTKTQPKKQAYINWDKLKKK
jgi:hypothetical protein